MAQVEAANMNRKSEIESAPVLPRPPLTPDGKGDARPNGEHVDRLTRELGRRPTWEERMKRARDAAAEMGIPPPPPRPVRKRAPAERAAIAAEGDRIREAICKRSNGWQFNTVKFFRDLRDGKLKDEPDAYWRKPD